jgi:peptide/nickel transport system substrate-binding protein
MKRLIIPVVLLLTIAFILSGCSNSSSTTTSSSSAVSTSTTSSTTPAKTSSTTLSSTGSTTSATAQPVSGGVLKVVLGFGFGTNLSNPVVTGMNSYGSFYSMALAECLADFDAKGNLVPVLAESWDMDSNAKTMTFHLRKGVKFHDGTDFDAEAVKWNWEVRMKRGAITGGETVQSIDVIDPNTVRLTFKSFSAINIISFAVTPQFMWSPTANKTNGDEWAKVNPVGTGPFKNIETKVDAFVKVKRNDNYWGTKAYLDGIEFTVIPDNMVAQAMVMSKQADIWCESATAKDARNAKDQGLSVLTRFSLMSFLWPDSKNAGSIYADKRVREAIEYAIDKEALVKTFSLGFGESLYQYAPSTGVAYNPDYKGRKYDPAKAKQLLTEAGYANGFKTTMLSGNDQTSRDVGTAIQSYLGAVGIEMTQDPADSARYFDALTNGWKSGLVYAGVGVNPGLSAVQFMASNFRATATTKPSNARPPEFIKAYDKLMAVPDLSTAADLGKQMSMAMVDDCTTVPVYTTIMSRISQPYVHVNYLDIHHRIWNTNLSWMDKH